MTVDPTHVTWLDRQQQRSWRAFLVGTTLLMDRLDRDLREQHRLSLPEYEILVRLSEAEGNRLPMAESARAMLSIHGTRIPETWNLISDTSKTCPSA